MPILRVHELHPATVHAPLVLLPTAGIVDLLAAMSPRDDTLDDLGRTLWWATFASALGAGLAGMAASQEVSLDGEDARDMMWLHGAGNLGLVLGALGIASLRSGRRATFTTGISGLAASALAVYTAYLGGQLVYSHGAGVKALGGAPAEMPALFSRGGAGRLARDAFRGLAWLFRRGQAAVTGRERIRREALGAPAQMASH
jgi:uncharacterized membrane protein